MYQIVKYPDPILTTPTKSVLVWNEELRTELYTMHKALREFHGVGLAANQVGIDKQMAVIDVEGQVYYLVNPVIVKQGGIRETWMEGCLSLPGERHPVTRSKKVLIKYFDEFGEDHTLQATGLLARVIQHEMDHLNGRLINGHGHTKTAGS